MNTSLFNQASLTEQRAEESRRLALKLMAAQHTKNINHCVQSWANLDRSTAAASNSGANQE